MKNKGFLVDVSMSWTAAMVVPVFWIVWFRKTATIYGRTVVIKFMRLVAMAMGLLAGKIMTLRVGEWVRIINAIECIHAWVRHYIVREQEDDREHKKACCIFGLHDVFLGRLHVHSGCGKLGIVWAEPHKIRLIIVGPHTATGWAERIMYANTSLFKMIVEMILICRLTGAEWLNLPRL